MTKRVFIVHGWDGYPEEGWLPWVKKELENKGFEVSVPSMPNPSEPKIKEWISSFVLGDLETEEEKIIGKPWIETPIDFNKIETITNNFVCVFSEDDPVIPLDENIKLFKERMNTKIIIERGKGHFSGSDGVTELPSALNSVLELAKNE